MRAAPLPTVEGDAPYRPGTARAALANRDFRIVWSGAFASNIGTWMQNVVLGAYVYELTKSPVFVSVVYFAQLGPLLLLSVVGGLLADTVDRRKLLLFAQAEQLVGSVVLGLLVLGDDPPRAAILGCVLAIGIGNALNAPAWVAMVPDLVGRENLAGAVSLNSTQMNASRVVGPAIAGLLLPVIGASGVFFVNAATYVFVILSLLVVRIPPVVGSNEGEKGFRRLAGGFRVARHDAFVRRCLLTLALFSLFCLPFIGQLPTIAAENLGMQVDALPYGLFYAAFGLGAVTGAVSIGTFLAHRDKARIVRYGLIGFAACLLVFALVRAPAPAYPVVAVLGFCYFSMITALNTVLQAHLADAVRGRVMALWLMGFGGTVPLGLLLAGPVAERTSITVVMLYGVVAALALAWYARDIRPAPG
jgi:MFS family permease